MTFDTDFFSSGDVMRRMHELERRLMSLESARRLESASIGQGGLRIKGSGGLRIQDGGSVNVEDGGDVKVVGGEITALDTDEDLVFQVKTNPPSIFMDPALIEIVATQAFSNRIESEFVSDDDTLSDTDLAFHDLSDGLGPSVTVPITSTGIAIVTFGALMSWQDLSGAVSIIGGGVGFQVSGATSRPPDVEEEFGFAVVIPANGSGQIKGVNQITVTGLNEGDNTFTLKYRNRDLDRFTTFQSRQLSVIGF